MKGLFVLAAISWCVWATGEMGLQDDILKEKNHCEAGLELKFEMPPYCDKYKKEDLNKE